jgi:glycosyltransferase involved in cell wall biosynthesis
MERKIRSRRAMRISISATNPCHLFPVAAELATRGALGSYYSGYPAWKLGAPASLSLRTHSLRTNVVYGLLKFLPEGWRPPSKSLFRWQDHGFDRWVGAHLEPCDFVHAMPGQCLHTFRAARRLGIRTVLNHATGPVREWVRIVEPELRRVGLQLTDVCPYDDAYFAREDEEYALADWHCAASSVVREQLISRGIDQRRIWQVPYGADRRVFHSEGAEIPDQFRIVFAGQVVLRKGLRTLLDALNLANQPDWRIDFYGGVAGESRQDLDSYRGATPLTFHGAVSQESLAAAFRHGSVLVLPSLEEGFGLVIPQALNCGMPAIVSDRVGGKDLIQQRENGSIVAGGDAAALAAELNWWAGHPRRLTETFDWSHPAEKLIELSTDALA